MLVDVCSLCGACLVLQSARAGCTVRPDYKRPKIKIPDCRSPRGCRSLRLVWLALMIWLGGNCAVLADDSADDPSYEFWPEVDVWFRLSPAWRASTWFPISKNVETHYREGNIIAQVDYAWAKKVLMHKARLMDEDRARDMKMMMVRTGYLGGKSLGDDGAEYTEKTLFADLHARIPLKGRVLVTHRVRTDLRWLGENAEFSERYRYRLMVEREVQLGKTSLVPFANCEAYYDSRYEVVNRVRTIGGASVAWSSRFAIEGNVTYQHDTRSSVTKVCALNVILHLYFDFSRHADHP